MLSFLFAGDRRLDDRLFLRISVAALRVVLRTGASIFAYRPFAAAFKSNLRTLLHANRRVPWFTQYVVQSTR